MQILPAIDLYEGKAVRLLRGEYEKMTVYSGDPPAVARALSEAGAKYVHRVDLEGARDGTAPNLPLIERIAADTGVRYLYSYECLAENGRLPEADQNGDGLHLTGEAFTKVMQYIRTHAYV